MNLVTFTTTFLPLSVHMVNASSVCTHPIPCENVGHLDDQPKHPFPPLPRANTNAFGAVKEDVLNEVGSYSVNNRRSSKAFL